MIRFFSGLLLCLGYIFLVLVFMSAIAVLGKYILGLFA